LKEFDNITVFTSKTSPRLRYVFKYILIDIIGFKDVVFEQDKLKFINSKGAKINYSSNKINDELWIAPHSILFETGLKDQEIRVIDWKDTKAFFVTNKNADVQFDLFGATFFLISRYEEYLPSIHDIHERFDAHESIAYKGNFLNQAVVNRWAIFLNELLLYKFETIQLQKKTYKFINTIDIDNAWAYKNKGLFRTIGAFARDIYKLDWDNFLERLLVLLGRKKDAYDTYNYMLELQNKYNIPTIYFFLFGDYGINDKNISIENKKFRKLIKSIADEAEVGIHPSYNSNKFPNKLESEIKNLGKVIKRDVYKSRQHFLKLTFPQTYQRLFEHDITDEYSMGYASEIGFRAGTCTPFYFYNIDLEIETKLRIHPFQVMEATLFYYMKLNPEQSIIEISKIIEEAKKVNGTFVSLWHNETLSNTKQWLGWTKVYEAMLLKAI
jgi:tetratricopeptide (TPR) repeat protein